MIILPKNGKGFTLVETLVAISIMLIALAGPLTIAAKGLSTAYYARDQITAFYLAQEGVEYVRNIRDADALFADSIIGGATAFPGDVTTGVPFGTKFTIDATLAPLLGNRTLNNLAVKVCPAGTCPILKVSSLGAGGVTVYGYDAGGVDSQFTREMTIQQVSTIVGVDTPTNSEEYRITVKVSWKSPLPNHSFTLVEDITKWHE